MSHSPTWHCRVSPGGRPWLASSGCCPDGVVVASVYRPRMPQTGRSGRPVADRYPQLAATADAALLKQSLAEGQVAGRAAWAREGAPDGEGLAELVDQHPVSLRLWAWRDHLEAVPRVLDAVAEVGRVSRQDVSAVARGPGVARRGPRCSSRRMRGGSASTGTGRGA